MLFVALLALSAVADPNPIRRVRRRRMQDPMMDDNMDSMYDPMLMYPDMMDMYPADMMDMFQSAEMPDGCDGCPDHWHADNWCDLHCDACPLFWVNGVFDGGDCGDHNTGMNGPEEITPGCEECPTYWHADDVCDLHCESCPHFWVGEVFDGNDCGDHMNGAEEIIPGCEECPTYWHADAVCDMHCESCPHFWVGEVFDGNDCAHLIGDANAGDMMGPDMDMPTGACEDYLNPYMIQMGLTCEQLKNDNQCEDPDWAPYCMQTCGHCGDDSTLETSDDSTPETPDLCQGCPEHWSGDAICDMPCMDCPHFWSDDLFDGGDCSDANGDMDNSMDEMYPGMDADLIAGMNDPTSMDANGCNMAACPDYWHADNWCDMHCDACPHFWVGNVFDGGDCANVDMGSPDAGMGMMGNRLRRMLRKTTKHL